MASSPRLRPASDSDEIARHVRIGKYAGPSETATAPRPNGLLVGRSGSWGSSVLRALEKLGCDLLLVSPEVVTPEYVRETDHAIILLDSTVSPEHRRMITAELIGSRTTIFYTFPVENGCWWLPALLHGEDGHGCPAFRRNEFPQELERILSHHSENNKRFDGEASSAGKRLETGLAIQR